MAMAVDALGSQAVSLTGAQIGIKTDATHTKARIKSISTDRIQSLIKEDKIVIAAGFQGIDEDFNITTLGRGGSDTTAVALAAVLHANACEIHTDVDGVYTTDPRLVPEARCHSYITYDEMLELASLGAGVMHSRAIEFAKKYDVPIHVRNSASDVPGTMISCQAASDNPAVCGAALTLDEARITVSDVPDVPGTSHEIFSRVAAKKVTVDMIVQNVARQGKATISFTVPKSEFATTLEALDEAAASVGPFLVSYDENVSKVSVVGMGMAEQAGVANQMFNALATEGINLEMITTSEIKISVLIARARALDALRTVHNAFDLHERRETARPKEAPVRNLRSTDTAEIVSRLARFEMEELFLDDISLDSTQGRVTIDGIPDTPGVAAAVFEEIARVGIFVDMIVQSTGHDGLANLSFTVPEAKLAESAKVASVIGEKLKCGNVSSSSNIAKLSVSGIGLRSHTGVAIRMFGALAEQGINVAMINTSEVRVNVVVDGDHGPQALACLEAAFADTLDKTT
jgi:aspartate kinase